MSGKKQKNDDEAKVYKMQRSPKDWEQIIQEAKKKEQNWKFMREEGGEDAEEREEEGGVQ